MPDLRIFRVTWGYISSPWLLSSLVCAIGLVVPRSSWAQIAYSTVDRATVRVIALRGVDVLEDSVNGDAIQLAVIAGGHGSGVIVTNDGLIVTAHHVIAQARLLVVTKLNEPSPYLATVVVDDPAHDVAVLSISGQHSDVVPIPATAAPIKARQTVFAIGYPLDVGRSDPQSSRGIVSGLDPSGMIQLNMSVNRGNSGGPVLDERDRLVGIAVAVRKNAEGITYAVPASTLKAVVATLTPERRAIAHANADRGAAGGQLLGAFICLFRST